MTADGDESTWRSWALPAAVIALVVFVAPLWIGFPLLDPDEGLHAAIAQEMVERGDWITPHFLGEPFLDKPILYFWAEAISLRLFGFNEAAVRLPGLMFGLLGAATTGLLAWRLFDRTTGWIAGILYATTILPTALAQAATHDVALVPWINLALLWLWESQRGEKGKGDSPHLPERPGGCCAQMGTVPFSAVRQIGPVPFFVFAGVCVGLSILTKGLTGVAAVGLAYGGYRLISWRITPVLVLQGAVVLIVAVLVAAPWYAALEIQNPGYLRYYIIDRHVLGAATASQPHGNQPWWYYFPILLGGGLPWIGYLPIVMRKAKGGWPAASAAGEGRPSANQKSEIRNQKFPAPTLLLWCWLIGWLAFVTAVRSKLATYLWPAFPPVAILAATAWARLIEAEKGTGPICRNGPKGAAHKLDLSSYPLRSFARTFVWSSWSGPLVLPGIVLAVQIWMDVRFPWPVWAAAVLVAALTPLPLVPWRAGRPRAALAAAALSLAAQFAVVTALLVPPVAERFSARDLAVYYNRAGILPRRLFVVEERIGSVVFYLDPRLRAGLTPERIGRLSLERPPHLAPGDAVAVPAWRIERKGGIKLDLGDLPSETAGRYRIYRIIKPRPLVAPEQ